PWETSGRRWAGGDRPAADVVDAGRTDRTGDAAVGADRRDGLGPRRGALLRRIDPRGNRHAGAHRRRAVEAGPLDTRHVLNARADPPAVSASGGRIAAVIRIVDALAEPRTGDPRDPPAANRTGQALARRRIAVAPGRTERRRAQIGTAVAGA